MAVAAGYGCTLVVTEHAQVYSFGANPKGQLGIGTREKSNTFKLIETKSITHQVSTANMS